MGCNGSKSAATDNQNGDNKENQTPAADNKQEGGEQKQDAGGEEEVFVTAEEATTYVANELGISEEKAGKIVSKVNKNEDGKISNKELIELWNKIKAKKDELRPKFEAYDKDNSGTVSADEAYTVLKEMFKGVDEKGVKAMIKRFDENNTGKMNFNEFIYFYAHICAKKEKLQQCFKELDKDGSGTLSSEEVCNVLMEECALEKNQALSLVEDFDQNKDNKLSRAEFEELFMKMF